MRKILIILVALLVIGGTCYAAPTSFKEAEELAMTRGSGGSDVSERTDPFGNPIVTVSPYKIYRIAGLGEAGTWTFYTIKVYWEVGAVVIIVYKPTYGFLIILRRDQGKPWVIYEVDHCMIALMATRLTPELGDGLVDLYLRPMDRLVVGQFEFEMKDEYRSDACWDIKHRE